jgi:NAD(P)-dependent dehydrogenase (short-subunit alcohol dehydrogenase family)
MNSQRRSTRFLPTNNTEAEQLLMAFSPFDLTGKVALITGGNSGIGLGMAEGIAQAGGDVCIWGTNAAKNAAAAKQLAAHGTRISTSRCDVSDAGAVAQAFANALETHGRIDGRFANAGIGGGGRLSTKCRSKNGAVSWPSTWMASFIRSNTPQDICKNARKPVIRVAG